MKIYKYHIRPGSIKIKMPIGSKILSIQTQFNEPEMWVLVNQNNKECEREFVVFATGQEIDENNIEYIGTFQIDNGSLIFHLFEKTK